MRLYNNMLCANSGLVRGINKLGTIQMKQLNFFFAIIITTSSCLSQVGVINRPFPFLEDSTYHRLIEKKEAYIHYGCMVEHSTVGEIELQRIFSDTVITTIDKYRLLKSIILTDTLYHLHNLAGQFIQYDDSLRLSIRKSINSNYLILRSILSVESEVFYGGGSFQELKSNKVREILSLIASSETNDVSKKYFIEVLYSLTFKGETGKLISNSIETFEISDSLKLYSSKLFKESEIYNPIFEHLESIRTWREMDRNKNNLKTLFTSNLPIMFFQILSQNPSTVLESKKLSRLKNQALLSIIVNAPLNSFFHDLRYFYLAEFLIDKNYSIRFLDRIMTDEEKNKYLNALE